MTANDYCIIQTESLQQLADLLKGVEDGIKYLLARVTGEGKDDIVEFEFMKGITSISGGSFNGFKNLAITSLPEEITSIGDKAFQDCTKLALTSLPEGITSIGGGAFQGCTSLALTSLPDGLTNMSGITTFAGCTSLALTSLPEGVTSIGGFAFYNCTSLTSLIFKGVLSSINANAFQGCTNLLDMYVPWSEGAVAGAPWGATNATIHYNYIVEGKE